MPYFAAIIQIYVQIGEEKIGGRTVRLQPNDGPRDSAMEIYAPIVDSSTGMLGSEARGNLVTHLEIRRFVKGKYLARHIRSIQTSVRQGALANAFWLPGPGNPFIDS